MSSSISQRQKDLIVRQFLQEQAKDPETAVDVTSEKEKNYVEHQQALWFAGTQTHTPPDSGFKVQVHTETGTRTVSLFEEFPQF